MKRNVFVKAAAVILASCMLIGTPITTFTVRAGAERSSEYEELLDTAREYAESGEYDKAVRSYKLAIKLDPEDLRAHIGLSKTCMKAEDYEGAAEALEIALDIDPVSDVLWALQCRLDVLTEDAERLEDDLLSAEVCGSDLEELYPDIARVLCAGGFYEKAVEYFEKLDPKELSEADQVSYSRALAAIGRGEEAFGLGLEGPVYIDPELDEVFGKSNITLESAEDGSPSVLSGIDLERTDLTREDLRVLYDGSEEFLEGLYRVLQEYPKYKDDITWQVYSRSPDGNSGLLMNEEYPNIYIAYYEGKYNLVRLSNDKGVEPNREFQFTCMTYNGIGEILYYDHLVYSPDGRYIGFSNARNMLELGDVGLDPMLLDLKTGEIIAAANYGKKLAEDDPEKGIITGGVLDVCFSSDGKYMYYLLRGGRIRLGRYDIEKDRAEIVWEAQDNPKFLSRLCSLQDGRLMLLRDVRSEDTCQKITFLSQEDGEWSCDEWEISIPAYNWRAQKLYYSPNSDKAFLLGFTGKETSYGYSPRFFMTFDAGNMKETGMVTGITSDYSAVSFTVDAFQDFLEEDRENVQDGKAANAGDYVTVYNVQLSPDGRYALMAVYNSWTEEYALLLVQLESMAVEKVSGYSMEDTNSWRFKGMIYRLFEWHKDDLYLVTADGYRTFHLTNGTGETVETGASTGNLLDVYDENYLYEVIAAHYERAWEPEGHYVIFDTESFYADETTLQAILRYQMSDAEAQERIDAGGMPMANIYTCDLQIDLITGEVSIISDGEDPEKWNILDEL